MTALREDAEATGNQSDIDLYFELAGYRPTDIIGVCWNPELDSTGLPYAHVKVANAAAEITKHQGLNCWINAAVFRQKPAKRGKATDMGRLPSLYADLDFKQFSKLPEADAIDDQDAIDTVNDVIAAVSALLGETFPTVVVNSGGGAQPRWRADQDITDATLARFGKLVRQVCQEHGGDTDSVYDRARLLRAPGSINSGWKRGVQIYRQPRPTEIIPVEDGDTINVDALIELLDARSIHYKSERERPPAPTQPLPRGRGNKFTQAAVDGAVADLKESATWPSGYRNMDTGKPRGWEKYQADIAYRLASLAKADWNDLTLAQAQQAFLAAAPTDDGWTYDMASQKWDYQEDYAVAAAPPKDMKNDGPGQTQSTQDGASGGFFAEEQPADSPQDGAGTSGEASGSTGPQAGPPPQGDRSSWQPEDLSAFIDGDPDPIEPCLWARKDGLKLLYPGLVHAIYGESESGKSFVMHALAADIIRRGGNVAIIDFESTSRTVIPRLKKMGVTGQQVKDHLQYIRPEKRPDGAPIDQAAWKALCAADLDLIVWDGVNESLTLWSASMNEGDEYTDWERQTPRVLAEKTGAPVVLIDHVVKDAEKRGRYGIGSVTKMNTLGGASYVLEVVQPLGRGVRGELLLWIGKDREGAIKPNQVDYNPKAKLGKIATVIVDSTGDRTFVNLYPPRSSDASDADRDRHPESGLWKLMQAISEALLESTRAGNTEPQKTSTLGKITGNKGKKEDAFEALVARGYITVREGANNAKLVRLISPFWEANARQGEERPPGQYEKGPSAGQNVHGEGARVYDFQRPLPDPDDDAE